MTDTAPLPSNATDFERILVEIDGRTLAIDADVVRRVKDPATCPAELLPWLAWEETVDLWEPDWTEEQKRTSIAQSWALHRHKGSRQSIVDAIGLLGYGARLEEWFEYGGAAYLFRMRVTLGPGQAMPFATLVSLTRTALTYKNVRSHLETIFIEASTPPTMVYAGAYTQLITTVRNVFEPFTEMTVSGRVYAGAVAVTRQRIRLG